MKNYYKFTCLIMSAFVLVLLGWQAFADEAPTQGTFTMMPDQTVQTGISNFIVSVLSMKNEDFSEEDFYASTDSFFSANGVPEEVDLIQLLLLYGGEKEHRTNPQLEALKRVMVFHLALSMDKERLVASLAPLLDETKDPQLLNNLAMALNAALFEGSRPNPDQVEFKDYLAGRKSKPPYGLIRYMYRHGREKALDVVGSVYGDKSTPAYAGAEKLGLAAVKAVAAGGHWWEELYAAEQVRHNSKLRDPELIKQLKKSKHAVVRETVQEIEDTK